MYPEVYLNRIEVEVPKHDGHRRFLEFLPQLVPDQRSRKLIERLAAKCQIEHRYSVLKPGEGDDSMDAEGFFTPGAFASTARRMQKYRTEALPLASRAVDRLLATAPSGVTFVRHRISHLIVTSCTGFYAPGLDLELKTKFDLRSDLERTVIGFMGCYAGFNAMRSARQIVRSDADAVVLLVNLELCSLHLQEDPDPEKILGSLQFADGCSAALISAEPRGMHLRRFRTEVLGSGSELIRWQVGDHGFEMSLSMDVPRALGAALPTLLPKLMTAEERARMKFWAIHPGGRSILDVVQDRLELTHDEMRPSREVLRCFGNLSSATIFFVLKTLLEDRGPENQYGDGAAFAFGPGLTVESMIFGKV